MKEHPRTPRAAVELAGGALMFALAVLAVYWPARHGGWLWDDPLEVTDNPLLRDPGGWWRAWVAAPGLDYYPLKDSLLWIQWRLWHGHVTGYHAVNLALHAANAFLVWRVMRRVLGAGIGAFAAGLLFAVHPVAVESVAWISEFKNGLSLFFLLLAMRAWLEGRAGPLGPPGILAASTSADCPARPAVAPYLGALGCFLAAMLCKTSVVMFPVVLLLYAWWKRGRIARADLWAALPFFAISLGLGLVTVWFQQHRALVMPGQLPPLGARLAQAGWSLAADVREAFIPVGLAPVYAPARISLTAVAPWLAIAAVLAALGRARQRPGARALLFGLGFFLINLAPVLGLIPLSYLRVAPRADHFLYISLVGVAGLAGAGLAAALRGVPPGAMRVAIFGAAAVMLAVLGSTARAYSGLFRDERTLWTQASARVPAAWLARNNLGWIYLQDRRPEAALVELSEAARLQPASGHVRANLGDALRELGRKDEALAQYREAVRLDPAFAGAHFNLGISLLEARQPEAAAAEFRLTLRLEPTHAKAHNNLGLALSRLGAWPEALAEYAAALRLNPGLPEAHVNLGNAWLKQGRETEAVEQYREALRADPDYLPARQNLSRVLRHRGEPTP